MLTLPWARLRHAWRAWTPVVLALAVAVAMPVITAAASSAASASALRGRLAALPAGERSVTVSYNGVLDRAGLGRLDALVSAALPRIAARALRREMLYRPLAQAAGTTAGGEAGSGEAFVLAGTDDLAGAVRLVSGRLPAPCTPTRCEVLALGAGTAAPPPELGLVVVGRAERADPLLLSGTFDPGPGVPVLLAEGIEAVAGLPALELFGRSYGWVSPLQADRVRGLGSAAWVLATEQVAQDLLRDGDGLVLTAPVTQVREQDRRARLSAQRLGLLGASLAVLLLAAAVAGGASVRSDHAALGEALRLRGASGRALAALLAAEAAAVAGAAAALGLLAAVPVAAVLASRAGLPVAATVAAAVATSSWQLLGVPVAAAGLLALTLRGRAAWPAVGAAALAAALAALLLAIRGGVGTGGGSDPLLVLLPALVLIAAALAAARLWPVTARLAVRAIPRRAVAARLGVGSVAGRPLRPAATAALFAAAIGAATFAASYRATLDRGAADQAAYAVPLEVRLTPGVTSQRPQDAVPPETLLAAAGQDPDAVVPVVRGTASLRAGADGGDPVQLLGLPPSALAAIHRWDAVTGASASPTELAARITPRAEAAPSRGTALPAGSSLRIATGAPLDLVATAFVRAADGRERALPLRVAGADGADGAGAAAGASLRAALPVLNDVAGHPLALDLVAITLRQPTDSADRRQHNLGEGGKDRAAPAGTLVLGAVDVDGAPVSEAWAGWAATDGRTRAAAADASGGADGDGLRVDYVLAQGQAILSGRPAGPGSGGVALPVLADRDTAARAGGGRLTLTLDGAPLTVRIAGVLDGFPTTAGGFVVADGESLARVLDLRSPLGGQPAEVWLGAPVGAVDAAAAPFDRLTVADRRQLEAALRAEPVATWSSRVLLGDGLAMLAIAVLAVVLLVAGERREDAARSYAWEADGLAPAELRRALWWRAVAVAGPAAPLGVAVGAGLSLATTRLVAVTAAATTPVPPLVPVLGWGRGIAAVAVALAAALGLAALVAACSARGEYPRREGSGA